MMCLTEEQQRYSQAAEDANEASRWGNLYCVGSSKYSEAVKLLIEKGLKKAQVISVIKALRTGEFKDNVMRAFDSVMNEQVQDGKS